jgi:predicted O-methyltransferase YrrM
LYNKNEVEELTARDFYKTRVVQTFSQDSSNVERSSDISIFEKTIDVAIAAAPSLNIDYKSQKTILCDIGKKYDTDKSSQRENVTDYRHCHPYTLFYDSLFTSKKNDNLTIAELGILNGSSLRMWQEYFPNANIYGFENNYDLISDFKNNYNNERIALHYVDVKIKTSIELAFSNINQMYDIIIEDTTHEFEDQIRTIESVYSYLKPGGVLIIEDIFKDINVKKKRKELDKIEKEKLEKEIKAATKVLFEYLPDFKIKSKKSEKDTISGSSPYIEAIAKRTV